MRKERVTCCAYATRRLLTEVKATRRLALVSWDGLSAFLWNIRAK